MVDVPAVTLAVAALAALHVAAHRLAFLDVIPRSRWLMLAGGVILNTQKEELQTERQSRLVLFFAGAAADSVI